MADGDGRAPPRPPWSKPSMISRATEVDGADRVVCEVEETIIQRGQDMTGFRIEYSPCPRPANNAIGRMAQSAISVSTDVRLKVHPGFRNYFLFSSPFFFQKGKEGEAPRI